MEKNDIIKKWPLTFLIKKKINQEIKHLLTISGEINYFKIFKSKYDHSLDQLNPSKSFSFKLDYFQKISIKCILKKENTLIVAAHTSSGKTVIAEYTIANAIGKKKKNNIYFSYQSIYLTKNLEIFLIYFNGVGLMTGDIYY
jgi:ATP-dependent RNA helicase DOB1